MLRLVWVLNPGDTDHLPALQVFLQAYLLSASQRLRKVLLYLNTPESQESHSNNLLRLFTSITKHSINIQASEIIHET